MHRLRLFACLAAMLLMLGAGAWARFWSGVPDYPYGGRPSRIGSAMVTRPLDPFAELQRWIEPQRVPHSGG